MANVVVTIIWRCSTTYIAFIIGKWSRESPTCVWVWEREVVKTKVAAEREKASSLLPAVLGISHYSNISAGLRCQRGKGQCMIGTESFAGWRRWLGWTLWNITSLSFWLGGELDLTESKQPFVCGLCPHCIWAVGIDVYVTSTVPLINWM